MRTHRELKMIALQDPGVRGEYERLEREEGPMLDAILKARVDSGLTQTEVAQRMGVSAPVVSRLENALVTGKHSPSIATLRKIRRSDGKAGASKFCVTDTPRQDLPQRFCLRRKV